MDDVAGRPRRVGVPYGSRTYTERITRTVYPDGTVTDSEPTQTAPGANWRALAQTITMQHLPQGTRQVLLKRTVTTKATAWTSVPIEGQTAVTEVTLDGSEPAGDVSGD